MTQSRLFLVLLLLAVGLLVALTVATRASGWAVAVAGTLASATLFGAILWIIARE